MLPVASAQRQHYICITRAVAIDVIKKYNAMRISSLKFCFASFTLLLTSLTISVAQPAVLGIAGNIRHGSFGTYFAGPNSIQIKGTYAYVATASSLQIIDVSNPSSPAIVSSVRNDVTDIVFDDARSIAISEGFALITSFYDSKLVSVNISDPLNPFVAARISNGERNAVLSFPEFIHVSGQHAYIANLGNNTIEILDISSPINPIHLGTASDGVAGIALKTPKSICVKDSYAYVACSESGSIEVIDISNPASPKHAGRLTNGTGGALLTQVESISIQGDYLYAVSIGSSSLEVIDIRNRSTPKHVGSVIDGEAGALLKFPRSVSVHGDFAYIASSASDALEIVNIADPNKPSHAGSLNNGEGNAVLDFPVSVLVSGAKAYVLSTNSSSLEIADVSDPSAPFHIATIKNGDGSVKLEGARSVYVLENYAYVACSVSNSLTVIDVSNPSDPRPAGIILDGQGGANLKGASGVFVSNGVAFVTCSSGQALEIIDVTDPTNPFHISTLSDGENGAALGHPYSLNVSGNYAFICNYHVSNLEIVDISNPASPTHVASINTAILPTAVVVKENYAYLSTAYAMQIVDISNPALPFIASNLENGTDGAVILGGSSLCLSDGYVYLTNASGDNVEIIDVSDPLTPKHVGKTDFPDYIMKNPAGILVEGSLAFVTSPGALNVLDFSNRNAPKLVTRVTNGNGTVTIGSTVPFLKDNHCFIVEPSIGLLQIIDLNGPIPPSSLQTIDSTSNTLRVRWNKQIGTTSYFVDLFTGGNALNFLDGRFTNVPVDDTTFLFTGLKPLTHYYYRVRSFNRKSSSLSSDQIHAFTFITPEALPPSEITPTSFVAHWVPVTDPNWIYSYSFDIALDEKFTDPFNIILTGQHYGIYFSDLANELTYYYRVRAAGYRSSRDVVYSPPSNVVTVKLTPITEVHHQVQSFSMEIFPVPATTEITIQLKGFDSCCEVFFAMYNQIGQIVYESKNSNFQRVSIPLLTLPTGLYSIKAIQGSKSLTKVFLKM